MCPFTLGASAFASASPGASGSGSGSESESLNSSAFPVSLRTRDTDVLMVEPPISFVRRCGSAERAGGSSAAAAAVEVALAWSEPLLPECGSRGGVEEAAIHTATNSAIRYCKRRNGERKQEHKDPHRKARPSQAFETPGCPGPEWARVPAQLPVPLPQSQTLEQTRCCSLRAATERPACLLRRVVVAVEAAVTAAVAVLPVAASNLGTSTPVHDFAAKHTLH